MTDAAASWEALRHIYGARDSAAREWKRAGGKVVGYLCDNVPVELILAAGCFPYRLSGDPDGDLSPTRDLVDSLYPPDLTARPDFASSILAQILTGNLDFLDLLIVPHNRHAIQAMYRELQEAAAENPAIRLPALHFLDKAWSPYFGADLFNRDAIVGLRDALGAWSGAAMDDRSLVDAIAALDANRHLLARITAERSRCPTRLSGTEALWIYAASSFLHPDQFRPLVQSIIDGFDDRPIRQGLRIFVGGSPFDHGRLYGLVEELGATIVAEDHCWGARLCDVFSQTATSPIDRIAERFHHQPACSIRFPIDRTIEASVSRALAAKADAAIHYVFRDDAVQSWETPDELVELRARGIPALHLAEQSYDCRPDEPLREQIGAFLATIEPRQVDAVA